MTDREKAIVMAYTGTCMLTKNKFQIFHKYVEDIMGRPIMTHEMAFLAAAIKEKSKADFLALCADESNSENPSEWIPVSERLPKNTQPVLMTIRRMSKLYNHEPFITVGYISWNQTTWWCAHDGDCVRNEIEVIAWRPLPEPYKTESEAAE